MAWIQSLAQELPYVRVKPLKKKKKKEKKKEYPKCLREAKTVFPRWEHTLNQASILDTANKKSQGKIIKQKSSREFCFIIN